LDGEYSAACAAVNSVSVSRCATTGFRAANVVVEDLQHVAIGVAANRGELPIKLAQGRATQRPFGMNGADRCRPEGALALDVPAHETRDLRDVRRPADVRHVGVPAATQMLVMTHQC
jgi:hypothetical protein